MPPRLGLSLFQLAAISEQTKKNRTTDACTPTHSQIFSPHGPSTPSSHGPFRPSPVHSDATVADWSDRTQAEYAFVRSYQSSLCCTHWSPLADYSRRVSNRARQGWAGNSKKYAVDHLGRRGVEATRPIANGITSVIAVPPLTCPIHRQPHDVPSQPNCNHRRAS